MTTNRLLNELAVDAYGDDEQLTGAEEALRHGEPARIVGVDVDVFAVNAGRGVRTGLTARVRRAGASYEVALADLTLPADSELGVVVAYRQGPPAPPPVAAKSIALRSPGFGPRSGPLRQAIDAHPRRPHRRIHQPSL